MPDSNKSIATWEIPSEEVRSLLAQGLTTKAIHAYRAQDHELLDGTPMRPPLAVVKAMVTLVKVGLWNTPLAITEEHARLDYRK